MRKLAVLVLIVLASVAIPRASQAQGITVTPTIGFYVPGDDFDALREGTDSVFIKKEGAFAMGFNVDLGFLRGSLAYATSATIKPTRITGEIGDAKVLAAAADFVLRPLPRLVVQPYALLGGGLRRESYSYDDDGFNAFPKTDSDFAVHLGLGADVNLGRVGISAEITDFISQDANDDWKRHDGFGFVGLKLRI